MVKIDDEVIRLILKENNVVYVGSVDPKGVPNISPRFVLEIIDNEKLLFADAFRNKTFDNLNAWPKVTLAIIDEQTMGGFQLKGEAEEVNDAALVALAETRLKEHGFGKPQKVWTVNVKEVYSSKPGEGSRVPLASAYS